MLSWTVVTQAGGYVIMGCDVLLYKNHGDLRDSCLTEGTLNEDSIFFFFYDKNFFLKKKLISFRFDRCVSAVFSE